MLLVTRKSNALSNYNPTLEDLKNVICSYYRNRRINMDIAKL